MNILDDFLIKDFVEQVTVLGQVMDSKMHDLIPRLFELHESMKNNDAVVYMIKSTLKGLLSENEEFTTEGITSPDPAIREICIEVAGEENFASSTEKLIKLATGTSDPHDLFTVLSALSRMKPPDALPLFRDHMTDSESMTASLSIEMIGAYRDEKSLPQIYSILEDSASSKRYEECNLTTAKAIEVLGSIRSENTIKVLVSYIHHPNPTARRLVHYELISIGPESVPEIATIFNDGDTDSMIMAANILGLIGTKESGDILVGVIDRGIAKHPNLKFAIYEALGYIDSLKSIICLTDALTEEDELILMAIVTALDNHINPAIIKTMSSMIKEKDSKKLSKTIISSMAMNTFEALYSSDDTLADRLMDAILAADTTCIDTFRQKIADIDSPRSLDDIQEIDTVSTTYQKKKILAVDDSKAMLNFYRSTITDLGFDITTATNGKEALDILEDTSFDLIISDMNMPVMDGIELTGKITSNKDISTTPIIMVTTESESSQTTLAQKAGTNDFLVKPFQPEILEKKIRAILPPE